MIVYALIDPRDGRIRYVGKTHRTAQRRLRRHMAGCYLAGNSHKERWIRSLLRLGLEPRIEVLQTCGSAMALCDAEREHIARLRADGVPLTNATDGGDGGAGPHTDESKAKIRLALLGKPKSPEHRRRSGIGQRGKLVSQETRNRLSIARRGRHPEPRYGSDNPKSKLSADAVREILALRGQVSQRELGRRFGVTHTAIRFVQQGRNWSSVREYPEARS